MNTIWDVPERPGPTGIKAILNTLKQQLVSIGFVLGGGFLLLASLLISALLAGLDSVLTETLPFPPVVIQIVHLIVSFGIVTMLFAAIFKLMPDAQIAWRDVLIGAAITSILFSVGRQLIGLYLGNSSTTSTYGAAGSLVVILIWIFYSAQILFLGAEFTQVYAKKYGSKIRYWGQPDSA
jgi:membrane protein